jgi:peptide/nickel transport system permease protein
VALSRGAKGSEASTRREASSGTRWLRNMFRRRITVVGTILILLAMLVALLAPILAPHDPEFLDPVNRLQPPSREAWLGTDHLGRDVLSRLIFGARISLLVGASVATATFVGGVFFGLLAGLVEPLEAPIMRLMDGLMAFPGIVLAIAIMAATGPSVSNVILALSTVFTPRVARVVRSAVLVIRESPYVEASRALGGNGVRIALRHVLPNCLSPVIVQVSFIFAYAMLGEAALSFLGVGVPPFVSSWGNMLSEGRTYLRQAPWITFFPGLAVMASVSGINLVGDGIRDALDPKFGRLLR